MRLGTLAFLLGILFCQTLSPLPNVRWIVLLYPLIILAFLLPRLRLLFLFALGLLWTVWRADMILAQKLPNDLEGRDIKMTGTVINLPERQQNEQRFCRWRFYFAPTPFKDWPNPGHLRLYWYGEPPQPLRPGQQWQLTVRLKRPHGMINPGVFDYEAWLFQRRILATGYVRPKGEQRLLSEPSPFNIDNLRYRLAKAIKNELRDLPNTTSTGILIGLAVGERQWITPEQKEVLQETGTAHLIAISGLHIGFVAWLVFLLGRMLWSYAGRAVLWLPAPRFAALFSLSAAFGYALLAGFSLPTQRAFIMVAVAVSGIVFARKVAVLYILALALLLVLLWDPLAVMSAGFWLSFGAVAVIAYFLSRREPGLSRLAKWGRGAWRTQWVVTLGLFPIILAVFGYIPLTSPLANAIAIPWVSFAVVPLTLLGTAVISHWPELGSYLLQIAAYTLDALWVFLDYLANVKWGVWQLPIPPLWAVIAAMVGVAILLLPRGFPARRLGLIWLLPLFFTPPAHPNRGEVWFTLLDVGQGLAAVVRTQNYVLVYDTGPKICSGFNTGDAVVVPFLLAKGIQRIDKLVISHDNNDHSGGAQSVLANLAVDEVLTSATQKIQKTLTQMPKTPKLADTKVLSCQTGQHWRWDGVDFQILHPPANVVANKKNNRSCVLKVSTEKSAILLPGDIEKRVEFRLAQGYPTNLKADILIAPHHGSGTSSTESFLEAVQPTIGLFSAGYRNRYRHPKKEIVQRYHRREIKTWNTTQTGAISFRLSADGISAPSLAREEMRRYWHDYTNEK
ncbi:MAG: DNA internalization-related competence protein ComEC/Rec2 [Candidatus Parabeggiatoa sp. nov. 2]|nr:MAG: DNA internalization-related competence protein ComEC/Rec2 [Beggiatoa sp. 4572_84]RKZ58288.1 MAG: DNA internalization-related competence protein ComEC/Rec2 [Gammaproteobacteria bacterium]